ncbi:unnamed protein product [[Actinomadura] parvosata subsp. kistnae]|uniref:Uncharacterized protein n=1 Tax=[Actinomadura] parvosata subsp. kistnae TaxID=1909395 RepID=A0A1U9ZT52_9ACTN|nr:hypothetical protein [Nonomuraea sp. ATCC 55076]AQZ61127.1 hypothetical protein BKM31_06170 [Nonomuraea sp. ATCC 55076]SPL87492.1 unnamed protein product [Actinomadura parvosata subsp. kistnae]
MSARERSPLEVPGPFGADPRLNDGFRRLAKAAGERAARAAERASRARLRLEALRRGRPPTDASRPVPVPLRATFDQALAYQVLIGVHEQAARHFRGRAERGHGDAARHLERAAWHDRAAEQARLAKIAWATSSVRPGSATTAPDGSPH